MAGLSRQVVAFDVNSLITLFWALFYVLIFYWFYRILKRMEKTLLEIKQLLEGKDAPRTVNGEKKPPST